MGDLIKNLDNFKNLGFDKSNQWILYGDGFEKFFAFFAQNISDANILTEQEVLECEELRRRGEYLGPEERRVQMQQVELEYPGLTEYSDADIQNLMQEIQMLEEEESMYAALVEDMSGTKARITYQLIELEENTNELLNCEKEALSRCHDKSKQLEELQRENLRLCNESKDCFIKTQSPPLFVHQLPLEQYFQKCDTFMQYFTLYVKENFKIQEYLDLDTSEHEGQEIAEKLETLRSYIQHYTLAYINEKSKIRAIQNLIDMLNLSQIHVISLADMERETRELELLNEHHLKVAKKTLLNDLEMHVQQRTQQQLELILYENTKRKLSRALSRRENVKRLAKIVSDALSNAELVWIATQLDLEKIRNRFDNTEQLNAEAQRCLRRIEAMKQLQPLTEPQSSICELFVEKMAEFLAPHSGGATKMRLETKTCLYEYEKFCRLFRYTLQSMLNKKSYASAEEALNELKRVESLLKTWVYDSPVEAPMFENVRFLQLVFKAKTNNLCIEKSLRNVRNQFQENVSERLTNDRFWRYSQLLWVWFLFEPKRMLQAIEEVKKVASKVPPLTGMKSLSGIKRM